MTDFNIAMIGGVSYLSSMIRADVTNTINSVGLWEIALRNIGGVYNTVFDVQDSFILAVDNPLHVLTSGRVDGQAVTIAGRDLEDIWEEYAIVKGVNNSQDLLFHNDFAYEYPDTAQDIDSILQDVFDSASGAADGRLNVAPSDCPIWYTAQAGTPVVGAFEFREGASFLTQLQELMRRAGYVFYIDDGTFELVCGVPGFSAAPAPSSFRSVAGDPTNNILGTVEYQTRDGDKHYNYVRLYGKAPMFDGYTEMNAADWDVPSALGAGSTTDVLDDTTTKMVGGYSIVACNDATTTSYIGMRLDAPVYNYTSFDMRNGEIGIWAKYDNTAGVPGSAPPNAGSADVSEYVWCALTDSTGNQAYYYGASTLLYEDDWGYCTFPLGENTYAWVGGLVDTWTLIAGTALDWEHIVSIEFVVALIGNDGAGGPGEASHFYIDGIGLPFAIRSVEENAGAQAAYRRRPYIDSWPHVRTQNALDSCAQQVLDQSQSTLIQRVSFMVPGTENLRYAGQSIDLYVPSIGIASPTNTAKSYYLTKVHHIVEPMVDVSKGYGFDWVTEVEAAPVYLDDEVTAAPSYDQGRFGIGSLYSPTQKIGRTGAGVR